MGQEERLKLAPLPAAGWPSSAPACLPMEWLNKVCGPHDLGQRTHVLEGVAGGW